MSVPETIVTKTPASSTSMLTRLRVTQISAGVAVALSPAAYFSVATVAQFYNYQSAGAAIVTAIAVVLLVVGWAFAPVSLTTRIRAGAFLASSLIVALALYPFLTDSFLYRVPFLFLTTVAEGLALCGWFILRGRPGRSFAALPILLVAAFGGFAPTVAVGWAILAIAPAATAWVGYLISRGDGGVERRAAAASAAQASRIEMNAQAMSEWQAAYKLANPGLPVPVLPPNFAPTGAQTSLEGRTNVLAVLALIFGVLGGYLAIVFGHVARSQIKRTGEKGARLALAGLILGYAWVVFTVAFIVIFSVLISTR